MAKKQTAKPDQTIKTVSSGTTSEQVTVSKENPKQLKPIKESITKFSEIPGKLDSFKEELIQYRKTDNKDAAMNRIYNFGLFLWRLRNRIRSGKCLWDEV